MPYLSPKIRINDCFAGKLEIFASTVDNGAISLADKASVTDAPLIAPSALIAFDCLASSALSHTFSNKMTYWQTPLFSAF